MLSEKVLHPRFDFELLTAQLIPKAEESNEFKIFTATIKEELNKLSCTKFQSRY